MKEVIPGISILLRLWRTTMLVHIPARIPTGRGPPTASGLPPLSNPPWDS